LDALAGPLYGLANQEVHKLIQALQAMFDREGKDVTAEILKSLGP